jgi:hypothetical protein
MPRYTNEQLSKYAADIVAGLRNAQFTPSDVAGVMAWGIGLTYADSSNGLTKELFLKLVLETVGECIEARGVISKTLPLI